MTTRIKTANRKSTLPKRKLRQVVAAAYAKKSPNPPASAGAAFTPVIITRKSTPAKKHAVA